MPVSLVFSLSSADPIPEGNLGRQAQAWFLKYVRDHVSGELAAKLHEDEEMKAYTVSDLFERVKHAPSLRAEKTRYRCYLRLTFLDDDLGEIMLSALRRDPPKMVEIWWLKLYVLGYTTDPRENKWAGKASYGDLIQLHGDQKPALLFASPASFHSEGIDLPLPLPGMVYRSIWRKWNAYSRFPINNDWLTVLDHCIQIEQISNLNTRRWKFAEGGRGAVTGFVGTVRFALAERACVQLGGDPLEAKEVLETLTIYAFYSGVGRKTSWGMGQVYPLSSFNHSGDQEVENVGD